MSSTARLTVTTGPDQGKVFPLEEELVHIGTGAENQVALTDEDVAEHQASIVNRDGRFAIYTPHEDGVEIDGSPIPCERWVWLPESARISLSRHTAFEFAAASGNGAARTPVHKKRAEEETPRARGRKASRSRKRSSKSAAQTRNVARFITDQAGDTLVKLGEDGHLPELHLAQTQGTARKVVEKKQKTSNPAVLYVVLGLSMLSSVSLLLFDFEPGGATAEEVQQARRDVRRFYGEEGDDLKPYQILLREAERARSRRDRAAERRAYRKVLNLLNAEDNRTLSGITGRGREMDDELRQLVMTIYSSLGSG